MSAREISLDMFILARIHDTHTVYMYTVLYFTCIYDYVRQVYMTRTEYKNLMKTASIKISQAEYGICSISKPWFKNVKNYSRPLFPLLEDVQMLLI